MALSMEEQRLLAEIERGLADEDPLLAARLSAFKHPGIAITLRLRRARLLASVASVIAVAAVSIVAYLFVPFAHRAPARNEVPGAPAITETGSRANPGVTPGRSGYRARKRTNTPASTGQSGPGTSLGPVPGSDPVSRAPSSAAVPGTAVPATSVPGTVSGVAGSAQDRAWAGVPRTPAASRPAGSAGATPSSTPAR